METEEHPQRRRGTSRNGALTQPAHQWILLTPSINLRFRHSSSQNNEKDNQNKYEWVYPPGKYFQFMRQFNKSYFF